MKREWNELIKCETLLSYNLNKLRFQSADVLQIKNMSWQKLIDMTIICNKYKLTHPSQFGVISSINQLFFANWPTLPFYLGPTHSQRKATKIITLVFSIRTRRIFLNIFLTIHLFIYQCFLSWFDHSFFRGF